MFFCNILEEQCPLNTLLQRTRVSKLDTGCAKVMKLLSSRFLTKMIDELYFDRIVHGNMIWTYLCLSSCGCDGVHMRCSLNLQLLLGKREYQKKNTWNIRGKNEHLQCISWQILPVQYFCESTCREPMAAACAAVCPLGKNIAAAAWPRTNNRFYSKYQKYHPGHRWEGSGREWKSGLQPETQNDIW